MEDVDAIVGLDQLPIPVPAPRDVARGNFTVQLDGLTQKHSYVLQVLVHLEWLYWKSEKGEQFFEGSKKKKSRLKGLECYARSTCTCASVVPPEAMSEYVPVSSLDASSITR